MKLRSYLIAVTAFALAAGATPASAAADDMLPDLGMYQLLDFHIEQTPDHHRLLRYTTIIVNVGRGNFQAEGSRASSADPEMSVVQRIFDDRGGSRVRRTNARMFWAGDGHDHWHLRDLETSLLNPLDDAGGRARGRASAKHGFCFFDNIRFNLLLPGAPLGAFYTGCGTDPTVLNQSMGLSVGWGDAYYYDIAYQWVDITGLRAGRYRLAAVADAQNWFRESNDYNNFTWTDLRLRGDAEPQVIGQGPFIPLPQP
jgi:Lysyl oxidase